MKESQVNDILKGKALLVCLGNLYEYIGEEKDKYLFQSVNDDGYVKASRKNLLTMPQYDIEEGK